MKLINHWQELTATNDVFIAPVNTLTKNIRSNFIAKNEWIDGEVEWDGIYFTTDFCFADYKDLQELFESSRFKIEADDISACQTLFKKHPDILNQTRELQPSTVNEIIALSLGCKKGFSNLKAAIKSGSEAKFNPVNIDFFKIAKIHQQKKIDFTLRPYAALFTALCQSQWHAAILLQMLGAFFTWFAILDLHFTNKSRSNYWLINHKPSEDQAKAIVEASKSDIDFEKYITNYMHFKGIPDIDFTSKDTFETDTPNYLAFTALHLTKPTTDEPYPSKVLEKNCVAMYDRDLLIHLDLNSKDDEHVNLLTSTAYLSLDDVDYEHKLNYKDILVAT